MLDESEIGSCRLALEPVLFDRAFACSQLMCESLPTEQWLRISACEQGLT